MYLYYNMICMDKIHAVDIKPHKDFHLYKRTFLVNM